MTERVTTSMASRAVLTALNDLYARLAQTEAQLASGKRLTKPSDDPYGTARALTFRNEVASTQQYEQNVQDATSWLSTTDTALGSMSSDLQRARDLVLQGANGTVSQSDRDAIASELEQLADSIKTSGNARYAGSYVLSGTETQTAPFTVGGSDDYLGNGESISRAIGPGVQADVNVTGGSVVSPILSAIRQAVSDLRTGGSPDALGTSDLDAIDHASDNLSSARAIVGARQNRMASATSRLQQLELAQTQDLSNTEDTDVAQAIIDYSSLAATYRAALQAGARLIQPSLMNYLR